MMCLPMQLLAAPACVDAQGGIGGTGAPVAKGGLGGTGSPVAKGGIGGTGIPVAAGGIGGTGIVGTITGFGSVCVNGLEVNFTANTPVNINGRKASVGDLALGQVISMTADPAPDGLMARSINVLNVLEGPVTQVAHGGVLWVMGQPVHLSSVPQARFDVSTLTPGVPVLVSGYRDSHGHVYATNIQPARMLKEASVIGTIEKSSAGTAQIGGMDILNSEAGLNPGKEAMVIGRWADKGLTIVKVQMDPVSRPIENSQHVILEGLVQNAMGKDHVMVNGFSVNLESQTVLPRGVALEKDQLVRVSGHIDADRNLQAVRVEIEQTPMEHSGRQIEMHRKTEGHGDSGVRASQEAASQELSTTTIEHQDTMTSVPDKADRIEPASRPEHVDRPEVREQIERVERPERPERVERRD